MQKQTIAIFILLTLFLSCDNSIKSARHNASTANKNDTPQQDSAKHKNHIEKTLETIPENRKPIFGYRFILTGDFDGDGKMEKLLEHFFSGLDNKETNKFYEGLSNYDQLVALTVMKEPYSFVASENSAIDTLYIAAGGQLLGLSYLKNEGDLNGDGTDEVSYVVNWADWSNLNTWHIVTYKNHQWQELYSFPIWDWQLPDLPETFNEYGLFGLDNKMINTSNDTLNKRLEKELSEFKGLVKKIRANKIQVIFKNEDAMEDTAIIDLKQMKYKGQ